MSCKFSTWDSVIEKWTRGIPTAARRYADRVKETRHLILSGLQRGDINAKQLAAVAQDEIFNQAIDLEMSWDNCGKPYYKVFPNMCLCMKHCSIEIPSDCLLMPFPVIEIRLPVNITPYPAISSFLVGCITREQMFEAIHSRFSTSNVDPRFAESFGVDTARSVLMSSKAKLLNQIKDAEEKHGKIIFNLQLFYQTASDRRTGRISQYCLQSYESQTIQDAINETEKLIIRGDDDFLSKSDLISLMKIIVATIFFAVDKHEVITPDMLISNTKINRRRRKSLEKIEKDRIDAKCRGWMVGAEIALPRSLSQPRHGEPSGRELHYGHVRSGHMRMQPCGVGNKKRKLIFIPPTVVRADLPMQPQHRGYVIGK